MPYYTISVAGRDELNANLLRDYRARRDPAATPEPFGNESLQSVSRPCLFVVQKHAARHLHYDLRLEIGGVLCSWALPKGPSLDPAEKRAAFATEDHPLEYADFEGIIPKGNYGAGAMIVWDRGIFVPLEDPVRGIEHGKLLFELRGYKLAGLWTLVQTSRKGQAAEWLLIKKPPGWARANGYPEAREPSPEPPGEFSVLSGLTVEELRDGTRQEEIRRRLSELDAPRGAVTAAEVEVMKPQESSPFSAAGWIFELKYDGFRALAARDEDGPRLVYRSGRDATALFPELARALAALPASRLLLDGEIAVLEPDGRPSFGRLQQRGQLTRRPDIVRAAIAHPTVFVAFDLLAWEEFDLRRLPLVQRKEVLARLLPPVATGTLRYADHIAERGLELYQQVTRLGLEGVVAKRADSPYRQGRSADWRKIRVDRTGDFVIVGWAVEAGSIRKLHLAVSEGGRMVYAGRVGTGFDHRELSEIRDRLRNALRPTPPFAGPAPPGRGHVWVEPELVCEVRFKEWTHTGGLRHPVFIRLRTDKRPEECGRPGFLPTPDEEPPPAVDESEEPAEPAPRPDPSARRRAATRSAPHPASSRSAGPAFSNLGKVFWPEEGYTKGDLIDYYRTVAPRLLPYLADRPLVLDRYPDGIAGKSFFQKNAPASLGGGVRTVSIWTDGSSREIDYLLCDDADGLAALANLAAIPLHVWSSRVGSLARPDWAILDLDPKGAPFGHVVEIARAAHALCDEVGLPSFAKTSGGSGLHVLLPLGGQLTHEQCRQLAELLARLLVAQLPALATVERSVAARGGRVYVDYLQNGHGKLLAAPWSVRPRPGATVSTPLAWSEVNAKLDPRAFTLRTVPERLKRRKQDPLRPVLDLAPDLGLVLARLGERL
jgi:bifunctional non-homologous end joining protein LigD